MLLRKTQRAGSSPHQGRRRPHGAEDSQTANKQLSNLHAGLRRLSGTQHVTKTHFQSVQYWEGRCVCVCGEGLTVSDQHNNRSPSIINHLQLLRMRQKTNEINKGHLPFQSYPADGSAALRRLSADQPVQTAEQAVIVMEQGRCHSNLAALECARPHSSHQRCYLSSLTCVLKRSEAVKSSSCWLFLMPNRETNLFLQ